MDPTTIDAPPSLIADLAVAAASPPTSPVAVSAPGWVPHPYLDEDLIPILQRAIDRIPPSHLLPPRKNETFNTPDDAWTRLQDYAFSQGFAIVTGQCGKADPRKAYKYPAPLIQYLRTYCATTYAIASDEIFARVDGVEMRGVEPGRKEISS